MGLGFGKLGSWEIPRDMLYAPVTYHILPIFPDIPRTPSFLFAEVGDEKEGGWFSEGGEKQQMSDICHVFRKVRPSYPSNVWATPLRCPALPNTSRIHDACALALLTPSSLHPYPSLPCPSPTRIPKKVSRVSALARLCPVTQSHASILLLLVVGSRAADGADMGGIYRTEENTGIGD